VTCGLALIFELFPSLWWGVLAINSSLWWGVLAVIDVRGWSWRGWAVASMLWIICLVAIKAWRDADRG
jgi:hypothetical protein